VGGGNRRLRPEWGGFRRKLLYCGRRLASDPSRPAHPGLSPVPTGHSERPAGASTIREYEIRSDLTEKDAAAISRRLRSGSGSDIGRYGGNCRRHDRVSLWPSDIGVRRGRIGAAICSPALDADLSSWLSALRSREAGSSTRLLGDFVKQPDAFIRPSPILHAKLFSFSCQPLLAVLPFLLFARLPGF
jgi:hypothetical protein